MSPGLRLPLGIAAAIAAGFTVTWLGQVSPLSLYLEGRAPAGQAPYMAMRWLGLFALTLLWLQLMVGLLFPVSSRQDPKGRAGLVELHTVLGIFTLLVVVSHPLFFMYGILQRTHHVKWDLLWPHFDQGFYPMAMSLGLIALWLLLVGSAAAGLRRTPLLRQHWTKVHWLNGAAYVLVTVHALLIGGETRLFVALMMIVLASAAVVAALVRRLSFKPT